MIGIAMKRKRTSTKSKDHHLNLFYNYNNEHLSNTSIEEINKVNTRSILEDNVTRAFIIFLDFLKKNHSLSDFIEILKKYIPNEKAMTILMKLEEPEFDLQNLNNVKDKKFVQSKDTKKLLLILSTQPFEPRDIFDKNEASKAKLEEDETDSKDISRKGPDNRADGWILDETNKIAVLVEVKIGDNRVDVNQLKRHIGGSQGFNLSEFGTENFDDREFNINNVIGLTWRQISDSLNTFKKQLSEDRKPYHDYFIDNLQEYIYMSGADSKLWHLLDKDITLAEEKAIFSNILKKMDDKIINEYKNDPDLRVDRKPRPLDGLWDIWGNLNKKNEIEKIPHISMGLWERNLGVGLDLPVRSQRDIERLKDQIENGQLGKFIHIILNDERYSKSLSRFRIVISEKRIWDWKKGQIRGEKISKFELSFDFDILKKEKDFNGFISKVLELAKNRKRFVLDFTLRLPSLRPPSSEEDDNEVDEARNDASLDHEVKQLLKDEKKLIDFFWDIFRQFIPIHNEFKK